MTSLRSGSATDVGRRRQSNQDMVLETGSLFAVADGMGGHHGGEVAAQTAVQALREAFERQPTMDGFERAIEEANAAVADQARSAAELRNRGPTLTAVAVVPDDSGDLVAVANIGDSRAYLFRDGELTQLTEDHSVPQELFRQGQLTEAEAASDPRRNMLTRVLGPSFGTGPDMQNLVPFTGDRLLLCSDGLYNEVPDADIGRVLRTKAEPAEAARTLVEMANRHGGSDNISVVVVDVVDDGGRSKAASAKVAGEHRPPRSAPPDDPASTRTSGLMTAEERNLELRRLARSEPDDLAGPVPWQSDTSPHVHELPSRRVTGRVLAFLLLVLLVLGAAGGAIAFYARGAYFVGLDEGRVTIFKGRPGGLLFFQPTVEERTSLTQAQVPAARADDVEAGHEVATLGEARRYVRRLEQATAPTVPGLPTTTVPGPTTTATPTTAP